MSNKRVYSGASDDILPLDSASTNVKRRKRASLPWIFVAVLFSAFFILVSSPKFSTRHLTDSVVNPSGQQTATSTELTGNGRTNDVLWDEYSLVLKGQRVFIQCVHSLPFYTLPLVYCWFISSGEFHPFRLPVPDLWLDVLQKIKAAGFNAISIYTHMGLINPSPGVIDFDGYRALRPLYEAAKQTGIWVVLRPGRCSCILLFNTK